MKYKNVLKGTFAARPNRFTAIVSIEGEHLTVHVKNTGRCRELLVPGGDVYLSEAENPLRKTRYDLVAVEKLCDDGTRLLINMDSQIPNAAVAEWLPQSGLLSGNAVIRREVTYGDSRFDLYVEDSGKKTFIEVKGVTLEMNGTAMFPDAPTDRGAKHLRGLASAICEGYNAMVIFVIQMKGIHEFTPNAVTDATFAKALREAASAGVRVMALDCLVTSDSITIDKEIPVKL